MRGRAPRHLEHVTDAGDSQRETVELRLKCVHKLGRQSCMRGTESRSRLTYVMIVALLWRRSLCSSIFAKLTSGSRAVLRQSANSHQG